MERGGAVLGRMRKTDHPISLAGWQQACGTRSHPDPPLTLVPFPHHRHPPPPLYHGSFRYLATAKELQLAILAMCMAGLGAAARYTLLAICAWQA